MSFLLMTAAFLTLYYGHYPTVALILAIVGMVAALVGF